MRISFILFAFPLIAMAIGPEAPNLPPLPDNQKIAFQNSIVVKVNGKSVSMMDVKKRLDLFFHRTYPHLIQSPMARYQFYQQSWRPVVMEMIDHELILADAAEKEIKLTDGEVREEMENRFGPNTLITLDKIGLTYDEAWKMIKDEMIVQRMSWWFIQSKAMQKVTPEDIRQAYRLYVKNNPPYREWKYRVLSIRGPEAGKVAETIYTLLSESGASPEAQMEKLKAFENEAISIQLSNETLANDKELSETYKSSLSPLAAGEYSPPLTRMSPSERQVVSKIFYCHEFFDHPAPKFEEMHVKLREELVQAAVREQSIAYIQKLRNNYGFDESSLKQSVPENLEPFSIE